MKPIFFKATVLVAVILISTACHLNKIRVTTIIDDNSGCFREMVVWSHDSVLKQDAYPLPVDASWNFESKKTDSFPNPFYFCYSKTFDNPLIANQPNNGTKDTFAVKTKFEKRFRWFYTQFTYEEVIPARFRYHYPVNDFLNQQELTIYFSGDYSSLTNTKQKPEQTGSQLSDQLQKRKTIEKKFDQWVACNLMFEIKKVLKDEIKSGKLIMKDAEVDLIADTDTLITSKVFVEKDFNFIKLNELYGQKTKRTIIFDPELIKKIEAKYLEMASNIIWADISCAIQMPGKITKSNADRMDGNKAVWQLFMGALLNGDVVMRIESRSSNPIPTALSFIFISLIAGGAVWIFISRRKKLGLTHS